MAACDRERNKKFFCFTVCILLSGKFFLLFLCDPSGGCHVCTIYAQDTINTMDD